MAIQLDCARPPPYYEELNPGLQTDLPSNDVPPPPYDLLVGLAAEVDDGSSLLRGCLTNHHYCTASVANTSLLPQAGFESPTTAEAGPLSFSAVTTADCGSSSQPKSAPLLSFMRNIPKGYKERRRAKEATRQVDYYEKLYGFVPKNAMSEAEWRRVRENAPKVKAKSKAKSTAYLVTL